MAILDKIQENASVEEGRESIELIAAHGMLSSIKLIMGSFFIVEKMGRLGMPAAMSKFMAASSPRSDSAGSA